MGGGHVDNSGGLIMNLAEAMDVFVLRLYDWSLRDFSRELRLDCPLLSSVGLNNRTIAAFVMWANRLTMEERFSLARALVKLDHQKPSVLRCETFTEEDKMWYYRTSEQMRTSDRMPPLATADVSSPTFRDVNPDECLDAIIAALPPVMGRASRRKSAIHCTRKVGDWKLISEFTFGRRDKELSLEFQFVRKDGTRIIGHDSSFPRSPFAFYGVYSTILQVPSQQDSEPMAKVMVKLAEHFVSQADPLFEGLNIDD
jgi:hypothetical protein